MPIKSGNFAAYVSFNIFPMKVTIAHKGQVVLKCNASELKNLRAVIKRAIQKAEQTAPSEEDKEAAKDDPLADDQFLIGG